MGCYSSKRPHVQATKADELIKILDLEEKFISKLIEENKNDANTFDTFKLNYGNRLHLIKSSLSLLQYKLEHNKEAINEKSQDWRVIMDILDNYYDLKDKNFHERNDDFIDPVGEAVGNAKVKLFSPTKNFIEALDNYLGYGTNEESSNNR